MAELVEALELFIAGASGAGEGDCTQWTGLMKLAMGLAKIADLAVDWVLVIKLYSGDYCVMEECGEDVQVLEYLDPVFTHEIVVPVDSLEGLGGVIGVAIGAAILGTFIEFAAIYVTGRYPVPDKPQPWPQQPQHTATRDVKIAFNNEADKYNNALATRKKLAAGRLLCDDLPTAAISIYLLVKARQFQMADMILLILSGGYALLTLLYYCTRAALVVADQTV